MQRCPIGLIATALFVHALHARDVVVAGRHFVIPEGFVIERVAGPPQIDRPIVADFDERGRLFVADSSGSNDPVEKQLAQKPHRIVCLEDKDHNGTFETSTVFADQMMFPEGVLCFDGSVYVGAPPSIWKLTDTDGDGKADRREEWFQGKTLTGCANDLHGPYLGPDGWIYWCKGAFAEQRYQRPNKPELVTKAAHIFRCRPDGSRLEPVITGGMDNPVEIAWSRTGDLFFTSTFVQHPGGGKRDAIVHGIYGGLYGKDHHVIETHPRTGDLMPIMTHLGPAAPSGLMRVESDSLGPAYTHNLFAALFNMHKITRHALVPSGSTFVTKDMDFVVSPDIDFHPTDVIEDADGSILIIDTGGWYKLCCPTSQLWKPDVLGAIYRVRRQDARPINDPRGLNLDWNNPRIEDLLSRLGDQRFAVRKRAKQELRKRGSEAVKAIMPMLRPNTPASLRTEYLWTLAGIDDNSARTALNHLVVDSQADVATVAARVTALWRLGESPGQLSDQLSRRELPLHTRRSLVEALGRLENRAGLSTLGKIVAEPGDRIWRHTLAFAEYESLSATGSSGDRSQPDCETIALSHRAPGKAAEDLLGSETDAELRRMAVRLATRSSKQAQVCANYFSTRFANPQWTSPTPEEAEFAVRYASSEEMTACLAQGLENSDARKRAFVLDVMSRRRPAELPSAWVKPLLKSLANPDSDIPAICQIFKSLKAPTDQAKVISAALLQVALQTERPILVRFAALSAVPGSRVEITPKQFAEIQNALSPDQPAEVRSAAIDVVPKCQLRSEQWVSLTASLKQASPLEIDRMLNMFAGVSDEKVGQALVVALKDCKARRALREETLKPRLQPFGSNVLNEAESLFAILRDDQKEQRQRLETLERSLPKGDLRRGLAVFHSAKANCAACHQMGYLGGQLGPDLNRIGSIRTKRDLLESIVFPSVSFVRSYEPTSVVLQDGRTLNGLLKRESVDEIELATGPTEILRLPRSDIEQIRPSSVSVMPAGLEQQLTKQDIADLLEFLQSAK